MNIDKLNGRDLDTAIVEHVLKWRRYRVGNDVNGENDSEIFVPPTFDASKHTLPRVGELPAGFLAPRYHCELRAAICLAKDNGIRYIDIGRDETTAELATRIARSVLRKKVIRQQ